ncbi:hypothetical protein RSOL_219790 [Rhizoctonia solani AG-3 Rhs1AP]|uniref:Uncharacterized protein n=1 Tax=Rhizoctonia solani AG-3 Rhs1AP TaxID=1086054 RepID=X8J834_9AGAM|nr:hypothetical protein RSOL_219790 [Rhizoctonia solani AG-3 Rhs1AP]
MDSPGIWPQRNHRRSKHPPVANLKRSALNKTSPVCDKDACVKLHSPFRDRR